MARKPETRLPDLIEAAIKVFTAKGYRRTQMSDVARAAGVSQGTLYNYVESKEALFYLILDRSFREDAPLPSREQLPIRTPAMDAIVSRFAERMAGEFRLPVLQRAMSQRRVLDARAELESVLREYYEAMARTRRALDLIERSTVDLPELADQLYLKIRRGRIDILTRFIKSRIALGVFRPLPDPSTAARLLLETIAWFARHRHNSADSAMITDEAALNTAIDFLVNGFIMKNPQPKRRLSRSKR